MEDNGVPSGPGHSGKPQAPAGLGHSTSVPDAYLPEKLETVARIIEGWIEWSAKTRESEGLTTEDGTHIMTLPTPCWPSHGQLQAWVELFRESAQALTPSAFNLRLVPSAEHAFRIGVEYAANHLAAYARQLGGGRDWRTDGIGWPVDAEGAARRELHAFADLIEECLEHESLSSHEWGCSLAQAIDAGTGQTEGLDPKGESAVPQGCATTTNGDSQ